MLLGYLGDQVQRLLTGRLHTHQHVDLLRADDDADGGEHAVHDGRREEVAQGAGTEERQGDLDGGRDRTDGERAAIPRHGVPGAQLRDRAQDDDDQARRRALDGELGATEPGGHQTADDGGQNTGDRGHAAGHGDAEAQRQCDQEDEEPGDEIVGPGRFGLSGRLGRHGRLTLLYEIETVRMRSTSGGSTGYGGCSAARVRSARSGPHRCRPTPRRSREPHRRASGQRRAS